MQFNSEGYYTFRLNRNKFESGILLYMRNDTLSKLISWK